MLSVRPRSLSLCVSLVALAAAVAVSVPATAHAQPSVQATIQRLKDDDFRVRTQAALALGASGNKQALEPLCEALDDSNTTVRAASAAALGKLNLGGKDCLEEHLNDETNASVRSVIKKALERLTGGGDSLAITSSSRYYVGIGNTTNKTDRSKSDVDRVVRSALLRALSAQGGFAVAPADETPEQARKVLADHSSLKAFFLWPRLTAQYAGGNLTVIVDLQLFTYPGKALKGSISKKLTMPDTEPGDIGAQDELVRMAAERLMSSINAVAGQI